MKKKIKKKAKIHGGKTVTTNTALRGPEKWLAIKFKENNERIPEKAKAEPQFRKTGLSDSTVRSQYFVDKYPLKEKTRSEWQSITEERLKKKN